ncbi:MAG TPA: alpha/beta hydrolase [Microthrixaceae bacterium]|nr:alpha/beta hydrolase [Microthrixaceae bacterium]RTL05803.1 MAG: alpha/beta hydrolase [Acidimicrobiia bacterium]MCB9400259.1 alpha/beta hydrolase [Microthrixaceae bacterium]MCC6185338.1 alpha/beta hydrolase [Microthrixaceae bacterium]MCO5306410.1 alpha/beta hydrolase [Microthrixaceae bacterium]
MSRPGDTSDDHQPTPTGDHEPDIDPDAEFDGPPIVEIAEAIRREGAPVPRRLGRSVVAEDRALGWAEFGHPDGDVVLWFHGTPGARTQVPPSIHQNALQRGFRVVTVERPGTGTSTDHRYRRIADFAPDVESLVDDLGIGRFAVVGLSGGGPYTLAVARHLPERVVVASLLGGLGPTRGPDAVWSYTRALRFVAPAFEVLRTPIGRVLASGIDLLAPVADPVFSAYAALLGFADRPVLRDPQFRAMFLQDLLAAHELRSVAHDMALFSRHWGFALDEVTPPVIVWQGLADTIVPPSHGHHQASRLPRAELRVRPGEGHFAGFADVATVLDRLREVWAQETSEPVTAP